MHRTMGNGNCDSTIVNIDYIDSKKIKGVRNVTILSTALKINTNGEFHLVSPL